MVGGGGRNGEALVNIYNRQSDVGVKRAAIDGLPEKFRVPLLMHYEGGQSYREIALALDMRESTLVGRLAAVRDGRALFSGGLKNLFSLADLKLARLLDTFDEWAGAHADTLDVGPVERFEPTRMPASSRLTLDLASGEIKAILWCTGFRPDYSWLHVPVVDAKGRLRHDGGVVDAPGLYALGLPVLRRRKSTFIHGAEDDARDIVEHLVGYLGAGAPAGR